MLALKYDVDLLHTFGQLVIHSHLFHFQYKYLILINS